jgi:biotin carboxyl carrier protein
MKYVVEVEGKEFEVEILDEKRVRIGGRVLEVNFESVSDQPVYSLIVDGKSYEAFVYPGEEDWQVLLRGRLFPVKVVDERERRLRSAAGGGVAQTGEFQLKAPMPGLIVSILVEEEQQVEKGQVLVILESMKMQNELKAPRAGVARHIRIKPGETVEQRQVLLALH